MYKNLFFLIIFSLTTLIGCAPSKSLLSEISIGENKQTVRNKMGTPLSVRGSIINKYNQRIEVWEYRLCSGGEVDIAPYSSNCDYYWLYFADEKLAQWGQAGDWESEADKIYEIRFR